MQVKGTLNYPSVCGSKWQLSWGRILAQNNMYLSCSWILIAVVSVTLASVCVVHNNNVFLSFISMLFSSGLMVMHRNSRTNPTVQIPLHSVLLGHWRFMYFKKFGSSLRFPASLD